MDIKKFFGRWIGRLGFVLAGILLVGCDTPSGNSGAYNYDPIKGDAPPLALAAPGSNTYSTNTATNGVLREGDVVMVAFADVPNSILPIEDSIKSDGTITLIYNKKFQAAGKSIGELQADIRKGYVPEYFVNMTPSVKVQDRFYSVGGEVRAANRYLWTGSMSVVQAINGAGGFTDFAKKTAVTVTRVSGEVVTVNCKKALTHRELDLAVYPGDVINVPKRAW